MLLKHDSLQIKKVLNNEPSYLQKIIYCHRIIFFLAAFQLGGLYLSAQYYEQKPEPEIAIGLKVITGKVIYGKKSFYITDPNSIALQALFRYDTPIRISGKGPYQNRYINFVLESGFLFCKANIFDSILTNDKSYNSTYLPIYMGLYTRARLSAGAQIFYWKGLKGRDIWGAKFFSLGYNAQRFRITASGEWYAQTKNTRNNNTLFSIDFLWKLILED